METPPEMSAVLLPVEKESDPEEPPDAVPVANFADPEVAASGVVSESVPLEPVTESPLAIVTLPPEGPLPC